MSQDPTNSLHLILQRAYIISTLTDLDGNPNYRECNAFKFKAILTWNRIKNTLRIKASIDCNSRLVSFELDQYIHIKVIQYKSPAKHSIEFITQDFITLPPLQSEITWDVKVKLLDVLDYIEFHVKLAVSPTAQNAPYVPRFKEIAFEISKLPNKIIKKIRDKEEHFLNGLWTTEECETLNLASLEQRIGFVLLQKNKKQAFEMNQE